MDHFEGRCRLDWWANASTLLGSVVIGVVISATDSGWDALGQLVSDDREEHEGFAFLRDLDPVFVLRFDDGGTIPVIVHSVQEKRHVRPDRILRAGAATDQPSD